MQKAKIDKSQNNNSVYRAMHILKAFTLDEPRLTLTEIAKKLGLSKSTVYRIINTLENEGLVSKEKNKYRLNINLCEMSTVALNGYNVNSRVIQMLERVTNITGEACYLGFLREERYDLVSINIRATRNAPFFIDVGMRGYLHASATGKAVLAFQDETYIEKYLNSVHRERFTENTMTDKNDILRELEKIRKRGYAIDDMECTDYLRCVGVPLSDNDGRVSAAISISGAPESITRDRVNDLADQLMIAAESISKLMYNY